MFKKAVIASLITLGAAQAHAGTIDGVTFNQGSQLISSILWESVLLAPDQKLEGVGIIESMNCEGCGGNTWNSGDNDTQLTYHFSGYTVDRWYGTFEENTGWRDSTSVDWEAGFGVASLIDFGAGDLDIYSDRVSTGTKLDPSELGATQAGDIANATDGNLWLSYKGVVTESFQIGVGLRKGTLFGSAEGVNNIHVGNTGFGYLDADDGLAFAYWDNESYTVDNISDTGATSVIADARIGTEASTTNSGDWPLSGTASLKTDAVPEPGTILLFGAGLLGLSRLRRRNV